MKKTKTPKKHSVAKGSAKANRSKAKFKAAVKEAQKTYKKGGSPSAWNKHVAKFL